MFRSNRNRLIASILLMLVASQLVSCVPMLSTTAENIAPSSVEAIEGTEFNRVVLSERAAERLDIQTAQVREEQVGGATRKVIPYSALIYGLNGETWAYVSTAPLAFVRVVITVDYIQGDMVILSEGPVVGTEIATVGVAELYGIDTGVGK